MIIYKISNLINNKVYIGKTIQPIKMRWNAHLHNVKNSTNRHLYDSMRHYGIENFIIEEIDNALTEEELYKKEIYWIGNYKSNIRDFGYNMTEGGDGFTSEKEPKKHGKIRNTEEKRLRKEGIENIQKKPLRK